MTSLCARDLNATVGSTSFTWAQALENVVDDFPNTSYLRPNSGGALLPWLYTVIIIVVHIPTVIIRVVRWELVQIWCLVFTFFTVVVYVQAYISTQFDPAKILVWTPIILIIDAGSMLQVFFLVIEARKVRVGGRNIIMDPPDHRDDDVNDDVEAPVRVEDNMHNETATQPSSSLLTRYRAWRVLRRRSTKAPSNEGEGTEMSRQTSTAASTGLSRVNTANSTAAASTQRVLSRQPTATSTSQPTAREVTHRRWYQDQRVWAAIFAALLFIAVIILQILALAHAIRGIGANAEAPEVQWCSTLFQPFGIAAIDGNCNVYDIEQSDHKGIGCLVIPGIWQQNWLKGTAGALVLELIAEIVDFLILYLVNSTKRWKGMKMKRPWISIFSGMLVLLATLICGILYASELPPRITEKVMVLMEKPRKASYLVSLTSAGLRGDIIGWNDGLFESWRETYFGT